MVSSNVNATFSRRAAESSRRSGGGGRISSKVGGSSSGNVSLNLSSVMNAQNNLSMIDAALGEIRQLLMHKESLIADIDALEQRKAILSQEVQVLEQHQQSKKKKNNNRGRIVQQNQGPTPPYHYGITEVGMMASPEEEEEEEHTIGKEKRSNSLPDLNCSLYGNGIFDDGDDSSDSDEEEEEEEEETNSNGIQAPAWRRSNSIVSNANKRNMKYHPSSSEGSRATTSVRNSSAASNSNPRGSRNGNEEETPSPPQKYICPLTWEIMKFPMRQKGSSHNKHYERGAILEWIYFGKATDPLTRQKLHPSDFELNLALQLEIQQWCDQNGYYDDDDENENLMEDDESFEEQQARTKRKLLRTLTPDQEREQQDRLSKLQGKRNGSTNQLMGLRDRILQKRDDRIRRSDRIQQRRKSER